MGWLDVTWWWSYLLAGVGITGLWLAGSMRMMGWVIGLGVQILWIAYAIATSQWGFIVSALAYAVVNFRNARRWRRNRELAHGQ